MHEKCQSHISSKIAEVMFLQKKSVRDILAARKKFRKKKQGNDMLKQTGKY